jgi:hypothetical protein
VAPDFAARAVVDRSALMERLTVDGIRVVEEGYDIARLPARERDPFNEVRLADLGFVPLGALRSLWEVDEEEEQEEELGFDADAPQAPLQLLRLERPRGTGEAVWRDAAGELFASLEVTDRGAWVTLYTLLADGTVVRSILAPPPPADVSGWRPPLDRIAEWLAGDRLELSFPPQEGVGLVQWVRARITVEALVAGHRARVVEAALAHGDPAEHAELSVAAAVNRRMIHVFEGRLHRRDAARTWSGRGMTVLAIVALAGAVPANDGWLRMILVATLLWLATGGLLAALDGGAAWRAAVWPPLAVLIAARGGIAPEASIGAICLATFARVGGGLLDVAWKGRLGAWLAGRQTEPAKVPAEQMRWAYRA